MDYAGRQYRDHVRGGAVVVTVKVVTQRTLINNENGPGVVAVHRIPVVDQPSMKDLGDQRHRRSPRRNPVRIGQSDSHVKIVQAVQPRLGP